MQWRVDGTPSVVVMSSKANSAGRYELTAESATQCISIGFVGSDAEAKQKARRWLLAHAPEYIARREAKRTARTQKIIV